MVDAIIGRDAELGALGRFLDTVPAAPRACLIEGEAGIGKTTLWLECVGDAEARSPQVLQARPAESETTLSYAALADLVGDVFEETRKALPAVQERALAAALLRDADEPADARTTATALVGILAELAASKPVLVAIDDVQWLDAASEHALTFVARRLPTGVSLLLARRANGRGELPLGLERALAEEQLIRIVPRPLSLAALHHLLADRLGAALPRPTLVRVADASGGNPFFALEIARALGRETRARRADEPLPVPRNVEELVASRVGELSEVARHVLLAAAALSRPTVAAVVEAVADGDARAGLVEAEEAGVLVLEPDRIRFAHPLVASAVYASASRERRRQLHERLASIGSDPDERARHLAASVTAPDGTVAAELEDGARRAARRGAPHAAAELFAASRRLTPDTRAEDATRRTLGEATALLAAGDADGAQKVAEEAAASPLDSLRANALALLGDIAWVTGSGAPSTFLEAALAAAPADRELAARIYPKLVTVTVPHPARALEHADAAIGMLSAERDPAALASVIFERLWVSATLGRGWDDGLYERWRELEAKAGPEAPMSRVPLIYLHSVDDFDGARARHAVEDRWYVERGEDLWRAERLAHLGYAELRAGLVDQAERHLDEGCDGMAHVQKVGPWATPIRFRSLLDAHRGRIDRARETLEPLAAGAERAGQAWWEALLLSGVAAVEFADGDHAAVDRALTRMRQRLDTIAAVDLLPDRSEPFHVESLVALGELERARTVLSRLEERARVFPRLWIDVTLPRARALVLAADGDVPAALAALDEVDADVAVKLPFDLAWNRLVQGRLHRRLKQKRAAAAALEEAVEIFERLGAPRWVEQARHELARVGLRRAPAELTPTERRVAELAAQGMTNREVATAAFMSPKTVEANLARVYRKLGIHSRAELGARIAQK